MPELCVDASIAIKWIIQRERFRLKALNLLEDAIATQVRLIAPPLFEMEIDSIITTLVVENLLPYGSVRRFLGQASNLPVIITTHPRLRQRAWQIALRYKQRKVYDATYAALAELRGCDFWTADRNFYEAVGDELTFVRYLPDYSEQSL